MIGVAAGDRNGRLRPYAEAAARRSQHGAVAKKFPEAALADANGTNDRGACRSEP